jgi:hypothetical protein
MVSDVSHILELWKSGFTLKMGAFPVSERLYSSAGF